MISGLTIPQGFDFDQLDLTGTRFENVTLRGCRFPFAVLNLVDFSRARLLGCRIYGCSAVDIRIGAAVETEFEHVSFVDVILHEKVFIDCRFCRCKFDGAVLEYVEFVRRPPWKEGDNTLTPDMTAVLEHLKASSRYRHGALVKAGESPRILGSTFESCDFTGVVRLHYVDFGGALLWHCVFRDVDLATCKDFRFDRTDVRGARLQRSRDPWSVLIRSYTGSSMLFTLLLLATYFTPFVVKGLSLIAAAQVEARLLPLVAVREGMPPALVKAAQDCENGISCTRVPAWEVAFGLNPSLWLVVTGVALLIYNAMRAFLTWRIAPMREEQLISGITPAYLPLVAYEYGQRWIERMQRVLSRPGQLYCSYAIYWWMHRVVRWIMWATLGLSIWHFAAFFSDAILVPKLPTGISAP